MSDTDERALQLARREGFLEGRRAGVYHSRGCPMQSDTGDCSDCRNDANRAYPLLRITRPRKRADGEGVDWCVINNVPHFRYSGSPGSFSPLREVKGDRMYLSVERVLILADLLATPTELVEEEG